MREAGLPVVVAAARPVPEDFLWDLQLLATHQLPELRQVVHVRQLLPKFVAVRRQGVRWGRGCGLGGGGACRGSYLSRGLKMFHTMRMKLVGWTT